VSLLVGDAGGVWLALSCHQTYARSANQQRTSRRWKTWRYYLNAFLSSSAMPQSPHSIGVQWHSCQYYHMFCTFMRSLLCICDRHNYYLALSIVRQVTSALSSICVQGAATQPAIRELSFVALCNVQDVQHIALHWVCCAMSLVQKSMSDGRWRKCMPCR